MPQVHAIDDGRYVFDLSLSISRVTRADLNNGEWHMWLMQRCGEQWPEIGANNFRTYAVSWAQSNEHLFVRCGDVVCLAACWGEPLGRPLIREIFMFVKDKSVPTWRAQMRRLYREMQIWAARKNADGVKINNACDYTRGRLMELVGAGERTELWLEPQLQ